MVTRVPLLRATPWSIRPNLERVFSRWTLFEVHVCVIDGQSAHSARNQPLYFHFGERALYTKICVLCWRLSQPVWRIILSREIKIFRTRSISVSILYILHTYIHTHSHTRLRIYEIIVTKRQERVAVTINLCLSQMRVASAFASKLSLSGVIPFTLLPKLL